MTNPLPWTFLHPFPLEMGLRPSAFCDFLLEIGFNPSAFC